QRLKRRQVLGMQRARLSSQMIANRVDDELRASDRTRPVAIGTGGSLDDHITFVEFARLCPGFALRIGTDYGVDDASGRAEVEFDPPLVMTLAEVKGMAVDFPAPLLRGHPAVASHHDAFLSGQPGDEFGFGN